MTVDLRAALTESLDIYGELYAAHNTLRERYRMVLLPGHPRIVALRGMLRALPAPPPPEPRRPVVGWARQRNGDETWWVLDLAASDAAELYAIVKRYPDRPLTWAVAVDPLDEDSAAWAEGTAADPDAAMLLAEDAAAAMLDAANAVLGRKP